MQLKATYTAEELVGLTGFTPAVIDKWFTETGRWYDKGPTVKKTLTQSEVKTMLARGNSNRRNSKARAFLADLRGESAPGIDAAELSKAITRLRSETEDEDEDEGDLVDVVDDDSEADDEDEAPRKHTKKGFSTASVTKMLTICKRCRQPNSNGYQYCSACHQAYRSGDRKARAKITA